MNRSEMIEFGNKIEYRVHPNRLDPVPTIDDVKLKNVFKENVDCVKETLFPIMMNYLKKTPITDTCSSHEERRQWRQQMPSQERKYYEVMNKLRVNNINSVFGAIGLLSSFTDNPEKVKDFEEKYNQMYRKYCGCNDTTPYPELTDSQKIEFTNWLDQQILDILSSFSAD